MTRALIIAALVAIAISPAIAVVSSSEPAALLVFPLVQVDGAAGIDTLVQVTNVDEADVAIRCLYQDPAGPTLNAFTVRLSANEPVAWHASAGGTLPEGAGTVPAVGEFVGVLRCVAATPAGVPVDRNVLVGSARLERQTTTPALSIDAAQYNASGFDAVPGAVDGDQRLTLGGDSAEFAACPESIVLQAFFDGAVLSLGAAAELEQEVTTTLAVTTCARSRETGAPTNVSVNVTNELGVRFSTILSLNEYRVVRLSQIDTANPEQSMFRAAVQGTETGAIRFTPLSGGVLILAVQAHADPEDATSVRSTATNPQLIGQRATADVIDLSVPAPTPTPTTPPDVCLGDCDGSDEVTINELITGVGIALGSRPLSACLAFDGDDNAMVTINELVAAVNHALGGCAD